MNALDNEPLEAAAVGGMTDGGVILEIF